MPQVRSTQGTSPIPSCSCRPPASHGAGRAAALRPPASRERAWFRTGASHMWLGTARLLMGDAKPRGGTLRHAAGLIAPLPGHEQLLMLPHPALGIDADSREKPHAPDSGVPTSLASVASYSTGQESQPRAHRQPGKGGVPPAHPCALQPRGMLSSGGLAQGPRATLR